MLDCHIVFKVRCSCAELSQCISMDAANVLDCYSVLNVSCSCAGLP